jgi:hypothetical protein
MTCKFLLCKNLPSTYRRVHAAEKGAGREWSAERKPGDAALRFLGVQGSVLADTDGVLWGGKAGYTFLRDTPRLRGENFNEARLVDGAKQA